MTVFVVCYLLLVIMLSGIQMATTLKRKHAFNKAKALGTVICCPICNKMVIKRHVNQVFCGNRKCSDRYWNIVNPKRGDPVNYLSAKKKDEYYREAWKRAMSWLKRRERRQRKKAKMSCHPLVV